MIASLPNIKKLALEMRNETSRNDSQRGRMQDIMDMVDELMAHRIDDRK